MQPGDVFAQRVKQHRERRGWTQADLAERLTAVGWAIGRTTVTRIEGGERPVSLNEAIAIAWTLGVPPALLWLPLGESDQISLAPDGATVHPDLARKWVIGQEPATASNQRAHMLQAWHRDMSVWWLHDRLNDSQEAVQAAETELRSAEYVGDEDGLKVARLRRVAALDALRNVLEEMTRAGYTPPALHARTVEAMRMAGINYAGPSYTGPTEMESK